MFIYKISNNKNNKVYIGQTIRPIEDRFQRHMNDATNNILDTHFARAIRKYGKENFWIEEIDRANNQEELNLKEQYWIRFYDSVNTGYNETDALYKCGGNTYISKTEEEMYEIRHKIALSKLKDNNPQSKKVKCKNIKTKEELFFNSMVECKEFFQENTHRFITTRVTHLTKSLYKGEWAIAYIYEDYDFQEQVNRRGTLLQAFNLITGETTDFVSIRLASRELNINRNHITKHINNNETNFTINNYIFTILN